MRLRAKAAIMRAVIISRGMMIVKIVEDEFFEIRIRTESLLYYKYDAIDRQV